MAHTGAQAKSLAPAHDCAASGCERLTINVSGQQFETRLGVLDRHPATLLGDRRRRARYYDRARGELFLDRHRPSFEAIFIYYQRGGALRRPYQVMGFQTELNLIDPLSF